MQGVRFPFGAGSGGSIFQTQEISFQWLETSMRDEPRRIKTPMESINLMFCSWKKLSRNLERRVGAWACSLMSGSVGRSWMGRGFEVTLEA